VVWTDVQVLISTAVLFLLATSLLGLALGLGLMLGSTAMLAFVRRMNLPVRLPAMAAGARWFAVILIAVGAYAALVLVKVQGPDSLAGLAIDVLKWFLVVGSLAAIVAGFLLLFYPRIWRHVEARANRWYSTRHLESRAAGAVILVLSLLAAVASALLLAGRH
jgi:hypothetical protein